MLDQLSPQAKSLPDTDWHVNRLYEFAIDKGASLLEATHSRYYIDVNRPGDGSHLYPGLSETELCPLTTFSDQSIYLPHNEPGEVEVSKRQSAVWEPYHQALKTELARLKSEFGYALLWDAHSIRSQVPRFFSGKLPEFNLGTAAGGSCPAALANDLMKILSTHRKYQSVLDGRFKGGYITRNYASPHKGILAVQLELSQITYMNEATFAFDDKLAVGVIEIIKKLIERFMVYQPSALPE